MEDLPKAVESAVGFIERHTRHRIVIGRIRRRELPSSMTALRLPNPRLLPFGPTLEAALAGVSRLRNRVIGRVFRERGLIEQWGSGLGRIIAVCNEAGLLPPRFEELGTNFRVTLFGKRVAAPRRPAWQIRLLEHLQKEDRISARDAAKLWNTSDRTARTRLRRLVDEGLLAEVGRGPRDPYRAYVLKRERYG